MITKLVEGIYEALVTEALHEGLDDVRAVLAAQRRSLDPDAAPHLLARYVHDRVVEALKALPGKDRLAQQVALANRLLSLLAGEQEALDAHDRVLSPGEVLASLVPAGTGLGSPPPLIQPLIPLSASELMVNGRHEVNVASEVRRELLSADRVDLLIAFLRFTGVRVIHDALKAFAARRPGQLRVLTTVYTGATEVRALEALRELGADIRVSYDTDRTRLHAKAWLFHRDSTFSTAIVGSSNLSGAAILDGLEWNVRLSNVDNPGILAKFQATFDQYWEAGEFAPYKQAEFEAVRREGQKQRLARFFSLDVRPKPHQQEILEALQAERERGHWRNLVVAATGTGKTFVAALDYKHLRREHGLDSLLFVAHRSEILDQSLTAFQLVLRDGGFGERLGAGQQPVTGRHVFASIQSLHADRLEAVAPDAFDVVIVDEFHHAAAPTYDRLLQHLRPRVLLGLTATPERADGQSVLGWFEQRVACDIRLWAAIDEGLLCPFQYFGVSDGTDLSTVAWRKGCYAPAELTAIYTAEDFWVMRVLQEVHDKITDPSSMRALGFCASIAHAEFMARKFSAAGLPARAVSSRPGSHDRRDAVQALTAGTLNAVFAVDLFNEGIDLPSVDTVLFLRPTESATIFLQQLGRGLRLHEDKACLTVLDFIGGAHRSFRFDLKFRALLGGTRRSIKHAVEQGFPHLPSGCALRLDAHAQRAVLRNIQQALQLGHRALVEDLRGLDRDVNLAEFLRLTDTDLEDVYAGSGACWTRLRREAGLPAPAPGPNEAQLASGLARMLHIDDAERLGHWRAWLSDDIPPPPADPSTVPGRLQLMLMMALGLRKRPVAELGATLREVWHHPAIRAELAELLTVLDDRVRRRSFPLDLPAVPLRVHASYTRDEIMAAFQVTSANGKVLGLQQGVYYDRRTGTDLLLVTLQKSEKDYSPTTRYDDYPISPTLFHWESQSFTRERSPTGQRYIHGASRTLLFVRDTKKDGRGATCPYLLLGPATYVRHQQERPLQIVWRLHRPMPPAFYDQVKVAAG